VDVRGSRRARARGRGARCSAWLRVTAGERDGVGGCCVDVGGGGGGGGVG
jgi:hypothetical protein